MVLKHAGAGDRNCRENLEVKSKVFAEMSEWGSGSAFYLDGWGVVQGPGMGSCAKQSTNFFGIFCIFFWVLFRWPSFVVPAALGWGWGGRPPSQALFFIQAIFFPNF